MSSVLWRGSYEQWIFLMGGIVFLFGIVYCAMIDISFQKLLKQIEHPEKKKNRQMRAMIKKFENIYQLYGDVPNVELFVKCDLYKIRVAALPIYQVHRFSVLLASVCVLLGGVGAGLCILNERSTQWVVSFLSCGVLEGILLMLLYYVPNFEEKRKIVYFGLREYLENTVVWRFKKEKEEEKNEKKDPGLFCFSSLRNNGTGEKRKLKTVSADNEKKEKKEKKSGETDLSTEKKSELDEEEEKLLEDFFEEFFTP